MGYETTYKLEILGGQALQAEIHLDNDSSLSKPALIWAAGVYTISSWYEENRQPEMVELSRKSPGVVFKLHGAGKDRDDIWIEYYLNGKMQRCEGRIVFDKFDLAKFKELNG